MEATTMLFVWGSHNKLLQFGPADTFRCGACSMEQPFSLICSYRLHHLWYLIRWIGQKDYMVQCPSCGAAYTAPQDNVAAKAPTKKFPWFDRFGAVLVLSVVVLLAFVMTITEPDYARIQHDLVAQPKANDIYSVNAAQLIPDPERPFMYSLARVRAVAPDHVTLQLARTYFEDSRGTSRDLTRHMYETSNYFGEDAFDVPRATLQRLSQEGHLISVTRP
jgi:hypothetical protein